MTACDVNAPGGMAVFRDVAMRRADIGIRRKITEHVDEIDRLIDGDGRMNDEAVDRMARNTVAFAQPES